MTTTISQPSSIDFARPLGRLEYFFLLRDEHPSWWLLTLQHSL